MPLVHGKSKAAFEHNVGAEMNAGKPRNQSLAIAYAIKRRQKKMAEGGMVEVENEKLHPEHEPEANPILKELYPHKKDPKAMAHAILEKQERLAQGGMVEEEPSDDPFENHSVDTMEDAGEDLVSGHDSLDSEPESDAFDQLDTKTKHKVMLQAIMSRMHAKARGRL